MPRSSDVVVRQPITDESTIGVVILTMGTRPVELTAAIDSILRQQGVRTDIVVVGNGWEPSGIPDGVRTLALPENLGIPDGRNAGVPAVSGDLLFFLDDDCSLASDTFLQQVLYRFAVDQKLGMLQPRIVDPEGLPAPRRWTPRLRADDPTRSSPVAAVVEMAIAVRRDVFEATGGWSPGFWYAHEGIDFAWRVWDQDVVVWYAGDLVAYHPVVDPRRHADAALLDARNRVWLARRNLPLPLVGAYLATWAAITTVRRRDKAERKAWWSGFREGWKNDPVDVRPMKWRTVARMTRAGRPPVI